jgi:hypothetical protein
VKKWQRESTRTALSRLWHVAYSRVASTMALGALPRRTVDNGQSRASSTDTPAVWQRRNER